MDLEWEPNQSLTAGVISSTFDMHKYHKSITQEKDYCRFTREEGERKEGGRKKRQKKCKEYWRRMR